MTDLELKFRKSYASFIRQQINYRFGLFVSWRQACLWNNLSWRKILFPKFWHREKTIEEGKTVFVCGISRSGTTLLATILDSHSQISLGYEILPGNMGSLEDLIELLDHGLDVTEGDFKKCGGVIRKSGKKEEGLFLARCHRVGVPADEVRQVFRKLIAEGTTHVFTLRERMLVAWRIVERKRELSKSSLAGFKLGPSLAFSAYRHFPGGRFIFILRDPRDVVASQIERNFDRSIEEICAEWNKNLKACQHFHKKHPATSLILRYEDLVSSPRENLERVFTMLPVHLEKSVFEFYQSKASVHESNHPNATNLKRDFFTSSIGRWKRDLSAELGDRIQSICVKGMESLGYDLA